MTLRSSGTQTATINTEHTLYTEATDNLALALIVDTVNMANGDVLELRLKGRVLSGGTDNLIEIGVFANAQGKPVQVSVPVPSPFNTVFTLKQTAGTGRNYDWAVVSY